MTINEKNREIEEKIKELNLLFKEMNNPEIYSNKDKRNSLVEQVKKLLDGLLG